MSKWKNRPFLFYCGLFGILMALSYGLVIRKLGIYWDDWAYLWTRMELGYSGLVRHFSFSRPVAGQIQNAVMMLMGANPLVIQLYALTMRVLCSALFGVLLQRVWRDLPWAGLIGGLSFCLYPGFSMQPIALNFGFSYLLMSLLFLSFFLMLSQLERPCGWKIPTAMLLAAVNLAASEYFFLLELMRPIFLWVLFQREFSGKEAIKKSIRNGLPYFAVFGAGLVYRLFFNKTQTLHYEFSLLTSLRESPLATLVQSVRTVLVDLGRILFGAWALAFRLPNSSSIGERTALLYCAVIILSFLLLLFAFFFWCYGKKETLSSQHSAWLLIGAGLIAVLLAGQPFWLTLSPISFVFPNSRFTLPFLMGIGMIFAGIFSILSGKRKIGNWLCSIFFVIIFAFSVGYHFVIANEYRRDWTLTRDFFYQLYWRIPDLMPDTTLVTNSLPIRFSTDNSLTAPLNWVYAKAYENHTMPFMLYNNVKRASSLSGLSQDNPIQQEYLSARFMGNTNDTIGIYYQAPGCVRVLDPEVDSLNQMISTIDRETALLTNHERILGNAQPVPFPVALFGKEPAHGWCYHYEQADLARQQGDWAGVAAVGDDAFRLNDHPNDPMERLPFIEGYAHLSRWKDALDQTLFSLSVTPMMNDPLCALWGRIERGTGVSAERTAVLKQVHSQLSCGFLSPD